MVTAQTLGGLHSARCLLYSVDFDEIERCQQAGDWDRSARILADAAQALERGGADFLVICTNTMHKVAPEVAAGVGIPLLRQKFGADPAIGGSVMVTALTDSGGFFIFLGLATLFLM